MSAAVAGASARDLDPDLRAQVISSCSADAMRLCPQSLSSEGEVVACMRKNRASLNATCRLAYDRAARVLARK